MAFSSLRLVPGNYVRSGRQSYVCEVAQVVEAVQALPARLWIPAAAGPDDLPVPTAVRVQLVQNDLFWQASGRIWFTARTGRLIVPPLSCGMLDPVWQVITQGDHVYVYWVLNAILADARGATVNAVSRPQSVAAIAAGASRGGWNVHLRAACLGCSLQGAPLTRAEGAPRSKAQLRRARVRIGGQRAQG